MAYSAIEKMRKKNEQIYGKGVSPKLKTYSEMANEEKSFVKNIEQLVDTTCVPVTVVCDTAPVNRRNKQIYLSHSSFLHIHDFAVV